MKNLVIIYFVLVNLIAYSQQKGVSPNEVNKSLTTGKTYAVVVGISDYQDPAIPDLRFADKDAEAFANFLRSEAGGRLDDDHLKVLINSKATMAQFAIQLDWLMENAKENDRVFIYFSGHGDVEKKTITQPGYLLCWDAPSRVYLAGGALALPMFQDVISTLSTQNKVKVVVITDACHSGKLSGSSINGSQATAGNLAKQYANELKILSCQPNEYSIEGEQWGGGRGAFSYHLIDALYGLADNNNDKAVTAFEIGRYLEDHVTAEVAPQSQLPMIIGNKSDKLTIVFPSLVDQIKKMKSGQMPAFAVTESRGMEEEVLSHVDTSIRRIYALFKSSLKEKRFFSDPDQLLESNKNCADAYYQILSNESALSTLHSTLRRNYAAALQDDAQQAMNIWLKAEVKELECIGKTIKLEPIPKQLERSAELLGANHYMYKSLKARQYLFEGIVLNKLEVTNPNQKLANKCIQLYRKSLQYEPNSPVTYYMMSRTYGLNLRDVDSSYVYVQLANQFAPSWVLPYVQYFTILLRKGNNQNQLKSIIDKVFSIDSTHAYAWEALGGYYRINRNYEKAFECFNKYEEAGGALFPCWFVSIGHVYFEMGNYDGAAKYYKKAIAMDSTDAGIWNNLGSAYSAKGKFNEAEEAILKSIKLDSFLSQSYSDLASVYLYTNRMNEAKIAIQKSIVLDSTYSFAWDYQSQILMKLNDYQSAEKSCLKAIELDSTVSRFWVTLSQIYNNTSKLDKVEKIILKSVVLDSTNSNNWNSLGLYYLSINETQKSINAFENAVSLNKKSAILLGNLGIAHANAGHFKEAEDYYNKSIQIDSSNSIVISNLGILYLDASRYEEAIIYFKRVISLDSMNLTAWNNLGAAYGRSLNYSNAEKALIKAIALDSSFPNPHCILAKVYLMTNKTLDAKKEFQNAISLNSNYAYAFLGLAYVAIVENKTSEAFNQLEKAIQQKLKLEEIHSDELLKSLHEFPKWNELMKKYFPDEYKDK